ncbi:hypothetical protein [Butyrivibrio fibrisolvens]|uniref:hypothetical protein n=1 Tax=Butyrivibrio fibrisolvens TaxID=831 RepID=UPI0003B34DB2|nr:hypothetical protein [Butyrivibrio fibrisolvens]
MTDRLINKLQLRDDGAPLIEVLKNDKLPVVLWGNGSLSYSVKKYLEENGINIDAVWINKRNPEDDIPDNCMDYGQLVKKFDYFNVVCGHSRYDLAESTQNSYAGIHRIYCFTNICYGQWNCISKRFIMEHIQEYEYTFELLEDDYSRLCMSAYLNCRNNENFEFIIPFSYEAASYFSNPFFQINDHEVYLDVGAYNGDSIREFVKSVNGRYQKIYALEPEVNSFSELSGYIKKCGLKNVEAYNNGCWNEDTTLSFQLNAESSSVCNDGISIKVKRIDEQFNHYGISLIKINFLHGVLETIEGAEGILKELKPNMVVTVGFDEWGLITIPKTIKRINPDYKLSLRYASPMPARLLLFAY